MECDTSDESPWADSAGSGSTVTGGFSDQSSSLSSLSSESADLPNSVISSSNSDEPILVVLDRALVFVGTGFSAFSPGVLECCSESGAEVLSSGSPKTSDVFFTVSVSGEELLG